LVLERGDRCAFCFLGKEKKLFVDGGFAQV
jgi:hypothetical protein